MNILITPDAPEWALANLSESIVKHNERFNFFTVYVHPRSVPEGMVQVREILKKHQIDVWHAQYWNSALQLLAICPELKNIPKILSHHNHYQLDEGDWSVFNKVIVPTNWAKDKLRKKYKNVDVIPYGIDLHRYSFIEDYPPKEPMVGYVGRVVPWKNLDRVCTAAKNLGYRVLGTGYIDKPDYWQSFNHDNLEYHGGVGRYEITPANIKDELYKRMTVFVAYSTGEKETGTLPLLEAMARGVPVLATAQGMARDIIEDGENGIIFDETNFEEKLKMLMEDEDMRMRLRTNALRRIRSYSEESFAWEYGKKYYEVAHDEKKVVSVVIPTYNRAESLIDIVLSIDNQDYPAKEIIVVDDGSNDATQQVLQELRHKIATPMVIRKLEKNGYGLARARNIGAIEAMGDILLFLDDRFKLQEGVLERVIESAQMNTWCFGKKQTGDAISAKAGFVENFSWILRADFFRCGGFNERMEFYGGMSQEIRERFRRLGFVFKQIDALATCFVDSPRIKKTDEVWRSKFLLHKMYGR